MPLSSLKGKSTEMCPSRYNEIISSEFPHRLGDDIPVNICR